MRASVDAVVFESGKAAAGAGVFLHDRGALDDGQWVIAVGELVRAAVDQGGAAPYPDGGIGLDAEAFGDRLGRRDFGELADELLGGPALLLSLRDQDGGAAGPAAAGVAVDAVAAGVWAVANEGAAALDGDD